MSKRGNEARFFYRSNRALHAFHLSLLLSLGTNTKSILVDRGARAPSSRISRSVEKKRKSSYSGLATRAKAFCRPNFDVKTSTSRCLFLFSGDVEKQINSPHALCEPPCECPAHGCRSTATTIRRQHWRRRGRRERRGREATAAGCNACRRRRRRRCCRRRRRVP